MSIDKQPSEKSSQYHLEDDDLLEELDTTSHSGDYEAPDLAEVDTAMQCHLSQIHHGNAYFETQIKRDLEMVLNSMVFPASIEIDLFSAQILRRIYCLLAVGNLHYRSKAKGDWQPWTSQPVSADVLPLVSALCHGSRILIEMPATLSASVISWLFADQQQNFVRMAATHGVEARIPSVQLAAHTSYLQEKKVDLIAAFREVLQRSVYHASSSSIDTILNHCQALLPYNALTPAVETVITSMQAITPPDYFLAENLMPSFLEAVRAAITPTGTHYGVDLALGGMGQHNVCSHEMISANGAHGHLYLYHHHEAHSPQQALLVGIEQSAPGSADQYGGQHDFFANPKPFSATGGDFFGKYPTLPQDLPKEAYKGLENIDIAGYYDNLLLVLDERSLEQAQTASQHLKNHEQLISLLNHGSTPALALPPPISIDCFKNPALRLNSRQAVGEKRSVLAVNAHRSPLANAEVKSQDEGFESSLIAPSTPTAHATEATKTSIFTKILQWLKILWRKVFPEKIQKTRPLSRSMFCSSAQQTADEEQRLLPIRAMNENNLAAQSVVAVDLPNQRTLSSSQPALATLSRLFLPSRKNSEADIAHTFMMCRPSISI